METPALESAAERYGGQPSSWIGQQIGRYRIVGPVGAGGMGEVYRAEDPRLGREVAIKILPPRLAEDPEALTRFKREARAIAALSHPNILALHDFDSDGDVHFAVMELLEGDTISGGFRAAPSIGAKRWKSRSPLPTDWRPPTPRASFTATSSRTIFSSPAMAR